MSTTITRRVSATASGGQTVRVPEAAVEASTRRVSEFVGSDELVLEGDQSPGNLLLEGDQGVGLNHNLLLEGDMQGLTLSNVVTKRIPESVA